MIRKIAILFGLGGSMFDPAAGEVALVARCKAIGLDTGASPFGYADSQAGRNPGVTATAVAC